MFDFIKVGSVSKIIILILVMLGQTVNRPLSVALSVSLPLYCLIHKDRRQNDMVL